MLRVTLFALLALSSAAAAQQAPTVQVSPLGPNSALLSLTADGGKEGPCSWLTDRFGLSWQVNPAGIDDLLSSPAAFQALMTMKKIDVAALRAAGGRS